MNTSDVILFGLSTVLILSIIVKYILNILKYKDYTLSAIEIKEDDRPSYQIYQPYSDILKKLTIQSLIELLFTTLFIKIIYNFI